MMIPNEVISTFIDLDDSSRCVTVASSYGHSKVSSYLKEMLAQNAEEKEEWDDAEYEDKFCDSFTLLKFCAWKFYTHIELQWIFILRLYVLLYSNDFHETPNHTILHKLLLHTVHLQNSCLSVLIILVKYTWYTQNIQLSIFIFIWTLAAAQKLHSGFRFEFRQGLTDEAVQSIIQYVRAR